MSNNKSKCQLLALPDEISLPDINRTNSLREIVVLLKFVMSVLKKKIARVLKRSLMLSKDLVCFRLIGPRTLLHCFCLKYSRLTEAESLSKGLLGRQEGA